MQSTGHCSRQLRSLTSTHAWVTTYVTGTPRVDASPAWGEHARRSAPEHAGGRDAVPQRRRDELKEDHRPCLGPDDALPDARGDLVGAGDASGLRAKGAADLRVPAGQRLEPQPFLGDPLVVAVPGHLRVVQQDAQHGDLVAYRGLELKAALPERRVAEDADGELGRLGHLRAQREP